MMGWTALVGLLAATPPAPARAFVGATLVDGTGTAPVTHATVVVRDGRIECAGKGCRPPADALITDVSGAWIAPGLIDAHVHFSQTGWADGRPDAFDVRDRYPYEKAEADLAAHSERFLRSQLCSGITSVFDNGGYPWTIDMARRERDDPDAPRVAAAGPLLATIDFWLNLPAERQFVYMKDADTARAAVRYLAARGAAAVKIWYIVTPDQTVEASAPSVIAAAQEAGRVGLPLMVHATGLAEAKVALKAGVHLLVHGVIDFPVDQEFLDLTRAKGTVYCPTLTVVDGYRRLGQAAGSGNPLTVDDPNHCVDAGTMAKVAASGSISVSGLGPRAAEIEELSPRWSATMAANLRRVAEAGIPIAMGTDAGNPLTLHGPSIYAEMEAMQAAGMTPMQVLVAATRGGSLAMGLEKITGTLEKGKVADLIVVDADPTRDIANLRKLRLVMRAGVPHRQADLRAASPR